MHYGREVRICDGGDFLVFHSKDGKILHPAGTSESVFWESIWTDPKKDY